MQDVTFDIYYDDEKTSKEVFQSAEIFVTGFHGLGAVGYISVKHIIDVLQLNYYSHRIPGFGETLDSLFPVQRFLRLLTHSPSKDAPNA